MYTTTHMALEVAADRMLENDSVDNIDLVMKEITQIVLQDEEVLIDGTQLEDGSVDPQHLLVETDYRYYFHVYTSKEHFEKCGGVHPFVLRLKELMEPIYAEDTFGGITLNYKKGDPMILISKEEIYHMLEKSLKDSL